MQKQRRNIHGGPCPSAAVPHINDQHHTISQMEDNVNVLIVQRQTGHQTPGKEEGMRGKWGLGWEMTIRRKSKEQGDWGGGR